MTTKKTTKKHSEIREDIIAYTTDDRDLMTKRHTQYAIALSSEAGDLTHNGIGLLTRIDSLLYYRFMVRDFDRLLAFLKQGISDLECAALLTSELEKDQEDIFQKIRGIIPTDKDGQLLREVRLRVTAKMFKAYKKAIKLLTEASRP